MNDNLINALETCLQALENGETLDYVLARFPHLQADLRSLLETSLHARTLGGALIPSDAQQRGRARLLQRAAEMREAQRAPRRTWLYNLRPLAVAILLLAFLFGGNRLVQASSVALPGDSLYSIKRTWEGTRLLLTFNESDHENLALEYETERLNEIDKLLAEGREEPVTFSGYVTRQENGLWTVAGIPVRVTDGTALSDLAIPVGAGVHVTGQTDAQGFLVAQSIDVLPAGNIIPSRDDDSSEDGEDDGGQNENPIIGGTKMPTPMETENENEKENENENEKEKENENEKDKEKEKEKEKDDDGDDD